MSSLFILAVNIYVTLKQYKLRNTNLIICHGITKIFLHPTKNQPIRLRNKAIEIANALLQAGVEEGIAIATGLKRARELFKKVKLKKWSYA